MPKYPEARRLKSSGGCLWEIMNAASKEWSETPEAAFQYSVVYAQKPSLLS
jgi:hypothetical protein